MYRNIAYNNRSREITLWAWDDDGNRIETHVPYKPNIYFEHKNGTDGVSIFETPLKKREFASDYDRKKFTANAGMTRLFNNIPIEQQFLIEKYGHISDQTTFTENPLRIFYLDIECPSPDEFPKATEAKYPVNLITIFDSLIGKYHTWGLGAYTPDQDDVIYHNCKSENELFTKFIKYWSNNYPDILTTWNGDNFDIPYIINRIGRLFGDSYARKLSPTNAIWSREAIDRFNNPITEWSIQGVSCIDYLKAYRKFSRNERENYTLNYIGEYEKVGGKNQYTGSLAALAISDWGSFVKYNIRDVEMMVDLEYKLHYLSLCRMIAYKGLTKFEKALATNNVGGGLCVIEAKKAGYIFPTFIYKKGGTPPGGLVRFPENGFNDDIISFDAASLYPKTICSLNLSPETKLGQTHSDENFTFIRTVRGKEFKLKNAEFKKWMIEHSICKSSYGTLFSQKNRGIVPKIIESIYADRKYSKDKGKKIEIAMEKLDKSDLQYNQMIRESEDLDTFQYTLKILMNSIYGMFGNQYSYVYDLDLVGSITLTGQAVNLEAGNAVKNYAKDEFDIDEELLIYGDTDSCFKDTKIRIKQKIISFDFNGKTYKLYPSNLIRISKGSGYKIITADELTTGDNILKIE